MIDRRRVVHLALAAAVLPAIGLLAPNLARAQQSFQRFFPFLIDIPGWTGNTPDGMAMEIPGNSIVTATRHYTRGDARLDAQVVTGPAAQGALAATRTGMKIETGDMHMSTTTIDGLPVAKTFTVHDKSGAVIVALDTSVMFSLTFSGVPEDEALTLAKQFNWKAIQAAVSK